MLAVHGGRPFGFFGWQRPAEPLAQVDSGVVSILPGGGDPEVEGIAALAAFEAVPDVLDDIG